MGETPYLRATESHVSASAAQLATLVFHELFDDPGRFRPNLILSSAKLVQVHSILGTVSMLSEQPLHNRHRYRDLTSYTCKYGTVTVGHPRLSLGWEKLC